MAGAAGGGFGPLAQQDAIEIDLMDAVRDVIGARKTILAAIVVAILVAILAANFWHKSYVATAELVPTGNGGDSGAASSELSGAASLLGVNLGQTTDSDFIEYKDLLSSNRLATALYQDDAIKAALFSAWDADKHEWVAPSGLGAGLHWVLHGVTGKPAWAPPGPFDVEKYLRRNLGILTDKVTGFFKLSIEENSPEKATFVLQSVIATADGLMRQSVKNRAIARIAYLNKALRFATQEDQRKTMIDLLSSQQKVLMLASADPTYAVKIIDPPAADPLPASPKFSTLLLAGVFLAIFGVAIWSVLRGFIFVRGGGSGLEPSLDNALAGSARRAYRRFLGKKDTRLASS